MKKKSGELVWGFFLVVLGIVFLISNLSHVGMEKMWPVFPLAIGLAFIAGYFYEKKNYGLLMPGTILLVISALFFYCIIAGWWRMETLWPVFILAPGFGFLAMYLGGEKEQGLLIPAAILTAIGAVFLFVRVGLGDYWPMFLVLAGVLLILIPALTGRKKEADSGKKE